MRKMTFISKALTIAILLLFAFNSSGQKRPRWIEVLDSAKVSWNQNNYKELIPVVERIKQMTKDDKDIRDQYSRQYFSFLNLYSKVYWNAGSEYTDEISWVTMEQTRVLGARKIKKLARKSDSLKLTSKRTDTVYVNSLTKLATYMHLYESRVEQKIIDELLEIKHEIYLENGVESDSYGEIVTTLILYCNQPDQEGLRKAVVQELTSSVSGYKKFLESELDPESESSGLSAAFACYQYRNIFTTIKAGEIPGLSEIMQRLESTSGNQVDTLVYWLTSTYLMTSDTLNARKCFDRFLGGYITVLEQLIDPSANDFGEPETMEEAILQGLEFAKEIKNMSPEEYLIYFKNDSSNLATLEDGYLTDSIIMGMKGEIDSSMQGLIEVYSMQAEIYRKSGFDSLIQRNAHQISDPATRTIKEMDEWYDKYNDEIQELKIEVEKISQSDYRLNQKVEQFTDIYKEFNSSDIILSKDQMALLQELKFQPLRLTKHIEWVMETQSNNLTHKEKNLFELIQRVYSQSPQHDSIGNGQFEQLRTWSRYRNSILNVALHGHQKKVIDLLGQEDENFTSLNELMALKGANTRSRQVLKNALFASQSPILIEEYRSLADKKRRWSEAYHAYLKNNLNNELDFEQLTEMAGILQKSEERLQAYLKPNISAGMFEGQWTITWKEIQNNLKKNEAFVDLERIQDSQNPNLITYLIFVITSKGQEIIVLEDAFHMENMGLTTYLQWINVGVSDPRGIDILKDTAQANKYASKAYDTYWKPIHEALESIEKVYLLPDGVYYSLNIGSLFRQSSNSYVIEELEIIRLNDVTDILNHFDTDGNNLVPSGDFVLFADPEYSKSNTTLGNNTNVPRLPQTRIEALAIDSLLKLQSFRCEMFLDQNASVGNLKGIENPVVLHVAAHGYYRPIPESRDEKINNFQMELFENPYLRSGLLLSTSDSSQMDVTNPDGVLSAEAASHLRLENTSLVVLSACETGLGEHIPGEGIMGLQRAFVIAGAETVLMSLWKVDDKSTRQLMVAFYENWLIKGQSKTEALRNAQIEMSKELSPYYWGAFVLVGK